MKIQLIGCGKMGIIILQSLLNNGINFNDISVITNSKKSGENIKKQYGVNIKKDINANIVFLCIKPNNFDDISLKEYGPKTLFVSIMAGITISSICSKIISQKVIRSMPNTPMSIGKGIIGYFPNFKVEDKENKFIEKIFGSTGKIIKLNSEDEIDKITAISGSGPAYYYYFTQIIMEKAIMMGFSEEIAKIISENTFIGSALLLEKLNTNVIELRNNVTSKGGTTQSAIETFNKNNFIDIINKAIDSAYNKSKQLSK